MCETAKRFEGSPELRTYYTFLQSDLQYTNSIRTKFYQYLIHVITSNLSLPKDDKNEFSAGGW